VIILFIYSCRTTSAHDSPFGWIECIVIEIIEEQERGISIAGGGCRRVVVVEVELGSGSGDGGDLDPDDGVGGSGLLDPGGEDGVVGGGEPDIAEIRGDVGPEVDVLAGVCSGSVPDLEPDLVVGQVTGR